MLIHVLSLVGLILFPLPSLGVALAAAAFCFLGGLGTTVCYHRALAHRAAKLNPVVEFFLTFFAMFNGSGAPGTWAANHRNHHMNAETELDVSSPRIGGFWWAHLRWLWQSSQSSLTRFAPDFDTPYWRGWNKLQMPILAISLCVGLPFGWEAFFWVGAIRITFALHLQCSVNSIAHMKKGVAPGEDSSVNIAWLTPFHMFQGENWHGNHHAEPNSARLGRGWAQIDLGWVVLVVLEKVGLAKGVRRPKEALKNAA